MKKSLLLITIAACTLWSCDLDKTREAELPEVDVDIDAEEGQLPAFDVDWANIDVGTTTEVVEVPKVVVVMEEEEIEVPTIDVDMPDEDEEERSLIVETEVSGNEHDLEIQEIRASERRLYVIATLEELETSLDGKTMRIQDQVNINAPDLDVRYIIVGVKPDRVFNDRDMYVSSMEDLPQNVQDATVIYNRS
ncbi:MAG: hypothetical protein CMC08_02170 [Flavobacteriaceae bacterium]|nr:hypothetical protein [Flavobacteriaceae bacterium]